MTWYVYALCEPTSTGAVRYIGKSRDPWRRLGVHRARTAATKMRRWVRALRVPPAIRILGEFDSDALAKSEERRIIAETRASGVRLLNTFSGGQSGPLGRRVFRFKGFGARVVSRRSEIGIKQSDLRIACGLPQATLSRIESGVHSSPSAETAVLIARALACSVEWLVTGEEREPKKASAA